MKKDSKPTSNLVWLLPKICFLQSALVLYVPSAPTYVAFGHEQLSEYNLCMQEVVLVPLKTERITAGPPRAHRSAPHATHPAQRQHSSFSFTGPCSGQSRAPTPIHLRFETILIPACPPWACRCLLRATYAAAAFFFSSAGPPRAHRTAPRAAHPAATSFLSFEERTQTLPVWE